jgi:hypothetical protein
MRLPQYGWAAKGQGLLAYTAMCDRGICDYVETPTSIFANARNRAGALSSTAFATPEVVGVSQTSARTFAIITNWQVHRSLTGNYKLFLHFVDKDKLSVNDGIAFQANPAFAEATSQWNPGKVVTEGPLTVQIPSSVPDGDYSIRIGLFNPKTGDRLPLGGMDDGTTRYLVGELTVRGDGTSISFTPRSVSDSRLNSAGTVISFGSVQTDGMISICEDHGQWVLRPFPRFRNFTVLLQKSKFVMPASVQTDGGSAHLLKPVEEGSYWKLPLIGAKSYSWPVVNKEE